MPPVYPPAYLVEFFTPVEDDSLDSDLHADLGVAIERVYARFAKAGQRVTVESSYSDAELEGMAFFDATHELVACLTVYRLDRDKDRVTVAGIADAVTLPEPHRTQALNTLLAQSA